MHYNEKAPESPGVLPLWKYRGETLACFLERIRRERALEGTPLTYAGRLDPMAEGIVLVLGGEARFAKERYLALEKTYRCEVLFGVATDSFDALGIPTATMLGSVQRLERAAITDALTVVGEKPLPYPPYSSKPVAGKPLFAHARAGTLPGALPQQHGKVRKLTAGSLTTLPLQSIVSTITADIAAVKGDFRQAQAIEAWQKLLAQHPGAQLEILPITATVSSGTYIRSIAHELGVALGVPALALRITRTRVGPFTAEHPFPCNESLTPPSLTI